MTSWALGDIAPQSAWGIGGRQVLSGPKHGDIFDHEAIVCEYPSGARVYSYCRAIPGCYNKDSNVILGSKGRAFLPRNPRIEGQNPWRYKGTPPVHFDAEHAELFKAVRSGKPLNNGDYMCLCTGIGILGQMACYTGQRITWDEMMKSEASFALPRYAWDVEPPRQAQLRRPIPHRRARNHCEFASSLAGQARAARPAGKTEG